MLWLGVYYPNWALQYACYCQQETYESDVKCEAGLNSGGRVLYDPTSLEILCCDRLCTELGVQAGMSLDTAQALASNMQLWPYVEAQTELAQDWLCQWSYAFSARIVPLVCQLSKDEPQQEETNRVSDTLLLEVGSMASLFGGLGALIQEYLTAARAYGLSPQFALADTPLAAQLLARYSPIIRMEQVTLFDNVLQNKGDASSTAMMKGYLQQALAKLSVDNLPISIRMKMRLASMGFTRLKNLTEIPRAELAKGELSGLIVLLAKLQGHLPDPQCFYQLNEYFYQKQILNYEVEYIQGLIFPLSRMFQELEKYLRLHQLAVIELKVLLTFRQLGAPKQTLVIAYPFAEYRAEALLALCRLQLENMTLYQPVTELAIYVEHLLPQVQPEAVSILYECDRRAPSNNEKAQRLQANLVARLGGNKLCWLATQSAHLPESAWQGIPVSHGLRSKMTSQEGTGAHTQGLRPSWLLTVPSRLHSGDVLLLKGPERISGPWWQEKAVERDYYVAQHLKEEHQGLCWVFKDGSGLWLHGWFG